MIKHTIEIARDGARLSTKRKQLVIDKKVEGGFQSREIPLEDIGLLVLDHQQISITKPALSGLLQEGAVVLISGENHHPVGMALPLSQHTEIVLRAQAQVGASEPLKKNLWKQLVVAKLKAQADLLPDCSEKLRIHNLATSVKSGDPENTEAQGAKIYWSRWINPLENFRRDPGSKEEGAHPLNGVLDYGYALFRATIARALVLSGLIPSLGLHHKHRANAFALADDLIEPLRPMVDRRVRFLHQRGRDSLDHETRPELLKLLAEPVLLNGEEGPLMVQIQKMVHSLVRCYEGTERKLDIPLWPDYRP